MQAGTPAATRRSSTMAKKKSNTEKPAKTKKTAKKTAKAKAKKKAPAETSVTTAAPVETPPVDIATLAYQIYLERIEKGIPGDEYSDWAAAERTLQAD